MITEPLDKVGLGFSRRFKPAVRARARERVFLAYAKKADSQRVQNHVEILHAATAPLMLRELLQNGAAANTTLTLTHFVHAVMVSTVFSYACGSPQECMTEVTQFQVP